MTCTRYALADWEWFIPLGDPQEGFANRQRIRAGLGYREEPAVALGSALHLDRSRDLTNQDFTTSDNIVNLRVKRVF